MITFPPWVDGDDEGRATRRLRYLILKSSVECTPGGNIASFADHCEIERTQVHAAIKDGKFSAAMAQKIEKKCGRKVVRREWLIYPLEVDELTT